MSEVANTPFEIEAEKDEFPVSMMCRVLGVSRAGYYAWRERGPSERAKQNVELAAEIVEIHQESRWTYGSPRVHAELRERGFEVNRMYLSVVIDLFSRRVVGWSMAEHMRVDLVLGALAAALGKRVPSAAGLVFHSDQGSQYAAKDYRVALEAAGITCSMSRRGNCWDNAVAESFFATLKTELVHDVIFTSRGSAKTAIAEWIEIFYNGKQRHSSLDYLWPLEFERRYYESLERAEVA